MSTTVTKVAFKGVSKSFAAKLVLDDVSCEVRTGTVHAFLGENGAGKSTLMKILNGTYSPNSGEVCIDGRRVSFTSPRRARQRGISTIHQHGNLVPTMTVLDNILLGDRRVAWMVNRKKAAAEVSRLVAPYGFELDLYAPIWKLEASDRQKVDIFRLVWQDADVLILDEPTSQLTPFESEDVLRLLKRLADSGKTILLITHNIAEAIGHSDQITVLRQGKSVGEFSPKNTSASDLAQAMFGRKTISPSKKLNHVCDTVPHIAISDVTTSGGSGSSGLQGISLEVYRGEVLGIAGVSESGPHELCHLLAGHSIPKKGFLAIDGVQQPWRTLSKPGSSCGYVPVDPRESGSVGELTVLENCFLRDVFDARFSNLFRIKRREMEKAGRQRISRFGVQPNDLYADCNVLSGGNLHRLILGREFAFDASLFVAINPTAGLDIAACQLVVDALRDHALNGNSVVIASPNIEELLHVSDRIAVFCKGQVVGIERPEKLTMKSLGLLMGGVGLGNTHESV